MRRQKKDSNGVGISLKYPVYEMKRKRMIFKENTSNTKIKLIA